MESRALVLLLLCFPCYVFSQTTPTFSKEEVEEDLTYLYNSLQKTHYNLYAYTQKELFDATYQRIKGSIVQDSLTLLEATKVFQRLAATAKNGHTEIDFPGQSYSEYAYAGGTVFPLEIAFEYGKPLVRKNWSENDSIRTGDEILSIDGVPIQDVCAGIYPFISAERPYFRNAKVELFSFPRYYWMAFGEKKAFDIELRSGGALRQYRIEAVDLIEGYEMKRTEVANSVMELQFINQSAYLNPGSFSGEENKYQQFVDSAFTAITTRDCNNLIIDLRNNRGGDNSFSDYLVSYIADKPFSWSSSFTLKTSKLLKEHIRNNYDTTASYWKTALEHENGKVYDYHIDKYMPQSESKRFTGNVYVLVNRQSHSQAALTAAQIQDYGFGTIVGEETGEYASLYASVFRYPLPRTGVMVQVSKGYIVRVNGNTDEQGVIPKIFIKDHLLDEKDEILEGLLERLEK